MIIEFIILAGLIGGIVYAATRWDEIETRLFPGHHKERSEHNGEPKADHTASSAPVEPDVTSAPVADDSTPIAKGFMRKKDLSAEPEVDSDDFHKTQGASEPIPEAAPTPVESSPAEAEDADTASAEADEVPAEPNPAADYAANPSPPASEPEEAPAPAPKPTPAPAPKPESPGGHVTGAPARPSQPAYVNASSGVEERVEDLAAEADAAYRDRDYEKAEQACLKILMREPKNHKYMTRIGQIYQEMGQLDDAKEAFETAKKLDPKNFFVLNRLAEVERLLNDRGGRTSENKGKRSAKDSDGE